MCLSPVFHEPGEVLEGRRTMFDKVNLQWTQGRVKVSSLLLSIAVHHLIQFRLGLDCFTYYIFHIKVIEMCVFVRKKHIRKR